MLFHNVDCYLKHELTNTIFVSVFQIYNQTCIKKLHLGQSKWSFKTGDLLKEVKFT